jgi:hypothetical protein
MRFCAAVVASLSGTAIKLISPFPECRGFSYVLVMVDIFTNWPEAVPLQTLNVEKATEVRLNQFFKTSMAMLTNSECLSVFKIFKTSEEFVSSAIKDMMPQTPTKTRQSGFLAGWNSPSPPPRTAPHPVVASVVPAPLVLITFDRRSPSPPATPRYRPSSPPARAVAMSKQQVLVTVPAPRLTVPNPTPRQLDRELATVNAKINVLEQRHIQLQAIHQQEETRRLEGAAKVIGQELVRAPTTIQINDNQLCLYASDEEL